VLAATSTDGMVRRLGRHWQRLHRIVYVIALLGLIHYWMQSKLEVWEPTIFFGLYFWLMGYRLLAAKFAMRGQLPLYWLATLTLAATMATALGEAVYFRLAFGALSPACLPPISRLRPGCGRQSSCSRSGSS